MGLSRLTIQFPANCTLVTGFANLLRGLVARL